MTVTAWTYIVESNQEEDKTRHCAAEEHHADGEQQDVAQSKVNLLTVYNKYVSAVADEPTRCAASRQGCCKQRWTLTRRSV